MPLALTRAVPPSIVHCELTHLGRSPIDVARATEQHERYEDALRHLGCTIQRIDAAPELPDSVFVEDTAVVLDELAIITRPGAESRRPEVDSVAAALRPHRPLRFINASGTMDGGDVLVVDRRVFIGRSARTNDEGIRQLAALVSPHGYTVQPVDFGGCLHLKTAVTRVAERTLLVNASWVDPGTFPEFGIIEVDHDEPFAANALLVGDMVLLPTAAPRTRKRLEASGIGVHTVDSSELAKAEAGLTCCSLIVRG